MSSHCSPCIDPERTQSPPHAGAARWTAVTSLSLGVFALVTAEFLPASLLTAISGDLQVSDGSAGQAVTATALVAAIAAPVVPLLTRRFDRKAVLLALTALLLASNVMASVAPSLASLLVARVLLGVALGGFWSMAAALAMRLVPEHQFARAMAVVLTGVSVATVCAAPIGAWMGDQWGWRSTFSAAAVLSALTFAYQLTALPPMPPRERSDLRVLGRLLQRPAIRVALLAVVLVISGHFAGFTYIRPLMENVTHLPVETISLALLGYGAGGFLGNFAGAWIAQRSERWAIVAGGVAVGLLALTLLAAASSARATAAAVVAWGFAFGAFPVGFQTWIIRAAPGQSEGAGGLLVAAFQVAIASGAIAGGLLVDRIGPLGAPAFMAVAMLLGVVLTWCSGPKGGPATSVQGAPHA